MEAWGVYQLLKNYGTQLNNLLTIIRMSESMEKPVIDAFINDLKVIRKLIRHLLPNVEFYSRDRAMKKQYLDLIFLNEVMIEYLTPSKDLD